MNKYLKSEVYKGKMELLKRNALLFLYLFLVVLILLASSIGRFTIGTIFNTMMKFINDKFAIAYLIGMNLFIMFSFIIAFSKFGNIKLGSENCEPEYTFGGWFAMLFSAGMGIGLVFWGVAEPIFHFTSPLGNIAGGSKESLNFAFITSFMHWGIHPWASYSIVGLSIAYFQFRKNTPALISSIFIPLLGEKRSKGLIGKAIDFLAVFATVAGVSTSLGMGTMQINSGLNYVFNIPENIRVQLIIIAVVTSMFIFTAVSGIGKGISIISNINLFLGFGIMIICFIIGPTGQILETLVKQTYNYFKSFAGTSVQLQGLQHKDWLGQWTVFYWAWWISWTPFVGMFIARISKGRTIRQFIIGVICAPTLASIIWFSIFGTLGINLGIRGVISIESLKSIALVPETAFFKVISYYPFSSIVSIITMVLLCTFFITSADSATFVLAMFTSKGNLNPSNKKKVLWGLVEALLAVGLLLSGGLQGLQAMAIVAAFPFIIIIILGFISLCKALIKEDIK